MEDVGAGESGKANLMSLFSKTLMGNLSTTLAIISPEKPPDKVPESTTIRFLVFY